MENTNLEAQNASEEKVRISGYISLVLAILFFSGLFKDAEGFLKFFDFTNVLGAFGSLGTVTEEAGTLAANFREQEEPVSVTDGCLRLHLLRQ